MKSFIYILVVIALGYGLYTNLDKYPELKNKIHSLLPSQEFHTLEIRYTAEQIMESHRKELLKSSRHRYLETQTRFYPYLLMEVKYSISPRKTQENLILWDLCDGEMVLETKGWDKTHGFGDCLIAGTNRAEFKIIHLLAKKGGVCSRQDLLKTLHLDNQALDSLIGSLRRKQLIVPFETQYRLHLEKPCFKAVPYTQMSEKLVTKTWKGAHKVSKRFSLSQVTKMAKAAFGEDFAVRHTSDIYLPVHSIVVQNPDGSLQTSLWNALNGKKILYSYAAD